MRPIPLKLLCHTAILHTVTTDKWGVATTFDVGLNRIRVIPSSEVITDKQNNQVKLSAVLFYDCFSSVPNNIDWSNYDKLSYSGNTYDIISIKAFTAANRKHHIEVGLK